MDKKELTQAEGQSLAHVQGQTGTAYVLIGLGSLFLFSNIFHFNLWAFFWPALFIGLGVWLINRPNMVGADVHVKQAFVSDVNRGGDWLVENEDVLAFVADTDLDFTQTQLPKGETSLSFTAFVNDLQLVIPSDVGVAVRSTAFVNELRVDKLSEEKFLSPVSWQSSNYDTAVHKIYIDVKGFVADIKIRH
jgi:predicted membrane protein